METIRCVAIQANGRQCSAPRRNGVARCRRHQEMELRHTERYGPLQEGKCTLIVGHGRCPHDKEENSEICEWHRRRFRRHQDHQHHNELIDVLIQEPLHHNPRPNWQIVTQILFATNELNLPLRIRYRASLRYFNTVTRGAVPVHIFTLYWMWLEGGGHGPEPQPPDNLGRIARDRQNVHTEFVSRQTNAGLEKLLAIPGGTEDSRIPDWFASKWLVCAYGGWDEVRSTVDDMQIWYKSPNCRQEGDWLYKKALDGLYYHIRNLPDMEIRKELWKRTFEECFEAIGLCCDGHIIRICNVLVGFDETFTPPLSLNEQIQNEMARLSTLELPNEEKVTQANTFFEQQSVPLEQRQVWLDALMI